MNLNKFTEKAQEAVVAAPELAAVHQHAQAEPEHLLVTLVEQQDGVVPAVLRKLAADPARVGTAVREHLARQPKASRTSRLAFASCSMPHRPKPKRCRTNM